MVVNWDIPQEPEEYTHRVGRTARRGRGGVSVSFVTERDEERVEKIEERISGCFSWGFFFAHLSTSDGFFKPETQLVELTLPEDKVLEKLNAVSTAKRLANMVWYCFFLVNITLTYARVSLGTSRLRLWQT